MRGVAGGVADFTYQIKHGYVQRALGSPSGDWGTAWVIIPLETRVDCVVKCIGARGVDRSIVGSSRANEGLSIGHWVLTVALADWGTP